MLELFLSNYIFQSTHQIVEFIKPMHIKLDRSRIQHSNTPELQYSNTGSVIWNNEEKNGE